MRYSFVVPCYNCIHSMPATVGSLQKAAERGDAEIILVDDGSPDGVGPWIDTAQKRDLRIHGIHQQNGGLVNAWKAGVRAAKGEYIVFCDADDLVDAGILKVLDHSLELATEYSESDTPFYPDLILYGCKIQYADGRKVTQDNLLPEGFYEEDRIREEIWPFWFSTGAMESGVALKSRWSKAFRREFLLNFLDDIAEDITMGEDDVTCFAAIMHAKSLFCMKGQYLYTYVRTGESMVGSYDPKCRWKVEHMMEKLKGLALVYSYPYPEQLDAEMLSTSVLYMKKEISRNPEGYKSVHENLKNWTQSPEFVKSTAQFNFDDYGLTAGLFAWLLIHGWYLPAYVLTKLWKGTGI